MTRRIPITSVLRRAAVVLCAAVLLCGCEEDDPVVNEIGTTRLFPTFPGLGWQRLKDDQLPIQVAQWRVTKAVFTQGDIVLDMLAGGPCTATQSVAFRTTLSRERCEQGIVVDARDEPVQATIEVEFTVQVRRALPQPIQDRGDAFDYDGDGLPNAVDNCPLIFNPRQDILKCGFVAANGSFQGDSDADGIADTADNCLWIANTPDEDRPQKDTSGAFCELYPTTPLDPCRERPAALRDGIGDACVEQVANVLLDGDPLIRMSFDPVDYLQPLNRPSYLVVDLGPREALTCDWDAGTCILAPDSLKFCIVDDLAVAALGCP